MTKPSSRSSAARALFRAAPLALMLLAAFGLFVSGCGDDADGPTTPTPTPTPTPPPPPPAPEPPAVPAGLQVADRGPDYILWSWTRVEGATGYDLQVSLVQGDFTNAQMEAITPGTMTSFRFIVAAETTAYARVRAKNEDGESDWSAAVSGTSEAMPIVLTAPTGLRVVPAETGPRQITWSWNPVTGASEYEVQMSLDDAQFNPPSATQNPAATAAPTATFTVEPNQEAWVRVRAVAGVGADRVQSDFALAVRGRSDRLPVTPPTGLAVASKGANFIEWSWNAVEGATHYDAQISLDDDDFTTPSRTFNQLTQRTHRVANLDPSDVVYLRVRAVVGGERSDWSASVRGETDPPPVVPLPTPTGLTTSNALRSTVDLDWADVTNDGLAHYEVEQQASGGTWEDVICDGINDNEPAVSNCRATGLSAGTAYSFRVRAIPEDDESLLEESAWSVTATATTTGRQTIGGGAGDLGVEWFSNENSITWNWEPRGTEFEVDILTGVQNRDAPCNTARPGDSDVQSRTSFTESGLDDSETRVLCVRTLTIAANGTETRGDWSYAWGVTVPERPNDSSISTPTARYHDDEGDGSAGQGGLTTALRWTVSYSNQPEFDYEFKFHVDETEKTNDNFPATNPLAGRPSQRFCEGLTVSDTISPGGPTTPTDFETEINLLPWADYRMCYRAINDNGKSEWAYNWGAGIKTRPLKPSISTGRVQTDVGADGETAGSGNFRLYWQVNTPADAPRVENTDAGIKQDYEFKVFRTTGDTQGTAADADDVIAACRGTVASNLVNVGTISDDDIREPTRAGTSFSIWKVFPNSDATSASRHYYLCARALDVRPSPTAGQGPGAWAASGGTRHGTTN